MSLPVSFNCCASLCTEHAITSVCVSTAEESASLRSLRELHPLPPGCSITELSVRVRGLREPWSEGFTSQRPWAFFPCIRFGMRERVAGGLVWHCKCGASVHLLPHLPKSNVSIFPNIITPYYTMNNVSIVLLALLCFLNLACLLPDTSMNKCSRNSFLYSSFLEARGISFVGNAWLDYASYWKLMDQNELK